MAFDDQKKCAEGFDEIAKGTLNATKTRELLFVWVAVWALEMCRLSAGGLAVHLGARRLRLSCVCGCQAVFFD